VERDLGTVFGKIHQSAEAAGIHLTRFDPQAAITYERLRRVPLTIGCNGTFAQTYEFLRKIEAMPLVIWVGPLKMEKDARTGKGVQCEVTLEVFVDNIENSSYAELHD
jgi:Tfp pilus assembly protein PilO